MDDFRQQCRIADCHMRLAQSDDRFVTEWRQFGDGGANGRIVLRQHCEYLIGMGLGKIAVAAAECQLAGVLGDRLTWQNVEGNDREDREREAQEAPQQCTAAAPMRYQYRPDGGKD